MLRLALKHLFQEIVGDLDLIARQPGSPRIGILTSTQRQGREHDPGHPPLRPLAESLGRVLGQLQSSARGNITRFVHVQGELPGPDLDQLSAGSDTAERHARVAARGEHQLRAGGNLVDEKRENRTTPLGRYDVHVIQYQDERVAHLEVGGQQRKSDLIDPRRPSRQLA